MRTENKMFYPTREEFSDEKKKVAFKELMLPKGM